VRKKKEPFDVGRKSLDQIMKDENKSSPRLITTKPVGKKLPGHGKYDSGDKYQGGQPENETADDQLTSRKKKI